MFLIVVSMILLRTMRMSMVILSPMRMSVVIPNILLVMRMIMIAPLIFNDNHVGKLEDYCDYIDLNPNVNILIHVLELKIK
jgi:hypothetical protein